MVEIQDAANFAKGAFVSTIRNGAERIASTLLRKRWAILRFPKRTVATSDRPVLFHGHGKQASISSVIEKNVFFPLSADRVLYMDNLIHHPTNVCCDGPPEVPALVNTLLKSTALRIVVGASPINELPVL